MKSSLSVVDLFCGCGGASLGLKLAGHKIVAAVDIDPIACKTFSDNLGLEPLERDLRYFDGLQLLELCGLRKGDVDLVVGCPPCQGFSSLRRTRYPDGDDSRKELVYVFLKRISEIQPRAVIFENVPGIARGKGLRYLQQFISQMEKMGYKTVCEQVNMANYGIPQFRKRVVALCVKDADNSPSFPTETHSNSKETKENLKPWNTVQDTIGDLPILESGDSCSSIPNHTARSSSLKVLEIIRNIPKDGGSRRSLPERLWLPCHLKLKKNESRGAESIYGRMAWSKPAPTMTGRCTTPSSGRFLHPDQDRAITPREAARLQTFPDDFVFPKEFAKAERLIGNAVPPAFMATLTKCFE